MNTPDRGIRLWIGVVLLGLLLAALATTRWLDRAVPSLSEEQIRAAVTATLEGESPAALLVTGRLDLTVTTRVENTRTLLPGVLGLDLGTTRATVRVPGRVSYGVEADSLAPHRIRLLDDGTVAIELPPLAIVAVEPDLSRLEVETDRGWARLGTQQEQVERRALALVERSMRAQALQHLRSSFQPRVNTARALQRILEPALRGLGMADPRFEFGLGDDVVVRPSD